MRQLWLLLGYDTVAEEVLQYFKGGLDRHLAIIEGPAGAGKSTLGLGIAATWRDGGGTVAILEGDDLNEGRELFPFQRGLSSLDRKWMAIGSVAGVAPKLIDLLAGTSVAASLAYEGARRLKAGLKGKKSLFLSREEQAIIADLERMAKKKPLLLIADNIHWWDIASLQLLLQLLSDDAREAYPFLKQLRVVGIQTEHTSQPAIHADYLNGIRERMHAKTWALRGIEKEEFHAVLTAVAQSNGTELNESSIQDRAAELSEFLYMLSNGHLALAWKAAEYLIQSPEEASLLSEIDGATFINDIFEKRLITYGAIGEKGLQLLELASLIGLSFRHDELSCLSGKDHNSLLAALELISDTDIITVRSEQAHFEHDYFRRYFRSRLSDRASAHHIKLADCLRQFRPSDYLTRYRSLILGGKHRAALELLLLHSIQNVRQGVGWERALSVEEKRDLEDGEFGRYFSSWLTAWDCLIQYDFDACLAALNTLPLDVPKSLQAEANFVRMSALLATRKESDRREAYELSNEWEAYWNEEADIGVRIALRRLYAQTHLEDKATSQKTERQIIRFLSARLEFDPSARDQIYRIQRSAGSLYLPEVAIGRVSAAADHFAPAEGMSLSSDPLEYYRCLVNLGAQQISGAKYEASEGTYQRLNDLIDDYGPDFFPRTEYARNNMVLGKYRLNHIAANDALEIISSIIESIPTNLDPYYLLNSKAVFATLAGEYDVAAACFDILNGKVHKPDLTTLEPNMVYLIRSNYAGFLHVSGQTEAGRELWASLSPLVEKIPYTPVTYFKTKHTLMQSAFEDVQSGDGVAWDTYLTSACRREVGPCWDNYGRGFRMPEIEFWRDA